MVERSLSWRARYKRLARDYERLALSLQQFHYLAFVGLILAKATALHPFISPYQGLFPDVRRCDSNRNALQYH